MGEMTTEAIVLEHAKEEARGTADGMRMLGLPSCSTDYYAANLYLVALGIVRELQAELKRKP